MASGVWRSGLGCLDRLSVVGDASRSTLALFEPVAVAVHLEDVDVVGEPVEQRAGQPLGGEHAGPLVERQVAGDDGGAALVALAEHLEQQFGAGLGERHVAEFVDDQQLVAGELALQAQQPLLVAGLDQLVDQGGGGGEADREALLAGGQPQAEGNVGLAGAAVADRDDVLAAGDVLRAGKLQHQRLVERRQGQEVEAVEAFDRRELRLLDPPLDHPPLALDQLQFGKAQQVADMVDALGGALPGELVVLAQEGRQLERLEVMGEQKLGRVGHDATPVSRSM